MKHVIQKFILLLFVICPFMLCAQDSQFESLLRSDLFTAAKVDQEFGKWLKGEKLVTPPATWVLLLKTPDSCLFYREAFEKRGGELRLARLTNCDSAYENADVVVREVTAVNIKFDERESMLTLSYQAKKLQLEHVFHLPSFKKKPTRFDLLSDGASESKLAYLSIATREQSEVQMLGLFNDNYRDSTAKRCHQVDSNCQNIMTHQCNSCAFGHYEVIDHHCPQGGSKFCGVNRCGEQGQPACVRGEVAATRLLKEGQILNWCSQGSPAGFCQQGLETHCDGNGVLICL